MNDQHAASVDRRTHKLKRFLRLKAAITLHQPVQSGDTCAKLSVASSMSVSDFLFLNPEVYSNCTNLLLGVSYCVTPVGDISTYSGYQAGPTLSITVAPATFSSVNTAIPSATSHPNPDFVFRNLPTASDTANDCEYYADYYENATDVSLNACATVARIWEVDIADFLDWNPSLSQDEEECALQSGYSYCVQKQNRTTRAQSRDDCLEVNEDQIQDGTDPECTCFTRVSGYLGTIGVDCKSFAADISIALDKMIRLNPWLKSDCDSALFAGLDELDYRAICVKTDSDAPASSVRTTTATTDRNRPTSSVTSATTTKSSRAGSATSLATPTPIQDGMTQNCNSFYNVENGDGCYDIAVQHGISLENFYAYNPAVSNDCSKLYPDFYVCVGVGSTDTCSIDVTFTTTYSTEWGESVWVVGSIPELGSWDVSKALMLTGSSGADGSTNWQTSAKLPANAPVSYKFVKLQTDGTPVWEQDPNRDFQTSSCGASAMQQGGSWHEATPAPTCTSLDVVFEVTAKTEYGEAVYVIGSIPALGEWNTNNAVLLDASEYTEANPLWKGSVSLATGQDVQYKFIKIGLDGGFTWEADPNRGLTVPTDCSATPLQSGAFQQ